MFEIFTQLRWQDALDQFRARPLDGKALEVVKPWRRIVSC